MRVMRRPWSTAWDILYKTRSGTATCATFPTAPDTKHTASSHMKALRADSGLNMLTATVQVGRDSTWRNCSQACDITGPPLPFGSCPQSNRTPDLFSRDLYRMECLSVHFLRSVFLDGSRCVGLCCASACSMRPSIFTRRHDRARSE